MCKKIIIYGIIILFLSFVIEEKELVAKKTYQLPDVENGMIGKGFTCTGAVFDEKEQVFYVGNAGRVLDTEGKNKEFKATIVKVNEHFEEVSEEIKLYELFGEMKDIQGLTIDYSDDSIWFCSFGENKIRHISKDGKNIGVIDYFKPIGISYDSRTDSLWILSRDSLENIEKDGTIISNISIDMKGKDQLWLDEENNIMYFTVGNNYYEPNYVYSINLKSEKIELRYILQDSFAIEGICIKDKEMYIFNDGFYHDAKINKNIVNVYDINL